VVVVLCGGVVGGCGVSACEEGARSCEVDG
jgi:hypothetical protein